MTPAGRHCRREAVAAAASKLEAAGVNWSQWARRHGFKKHNVMNVVRGRRACMRGESFRIAVALGAVPATSPREERRKQAAKVVEATAWNARSSPTLAAAVRRLRVPPAVREAGLLEALEELIAACDQAVATVHGRRAGQYGGALRQARHVARRARLDRGDG